MPVDPQIAAVLDLLEKLDGTPMQGMSPVQARESFSALVVGGRAPQHVVRVRAVEDTVIPGPAGDLRVRVYRPEVDGALPTVVMLHGGGWVIGDLETHDNTARQLARDAGAVVVSVDYRLAPEARFPAAVEDAVAATRWAADRLADLGGGPALGIAGDSAGGNLAAVVTQLLRDDGGPRIDAQLLIYPAVDAAGDYPSRDENGTGYYLETPTMEWFMAQYVGPDADPGVVTDPRLSPLLAEDLHGLPPAVVVTAEYDPLRDEGEAYAAALTDAGVPVHLRRVDGMVHGFFDMAAVAPAADLAVRDACAQLSDLLRLEEDL